MKRLAATMVLALLPLPALAAPPMPTTSTDASACKWEWKTGGGLGVWTERCSFNGVWAVAYSEADRGFVLTVDGDDALVVLQSFAKAADADAASILPTLKAATKIPNDDECVMEPAAPETLDALGPIPKTRAFFEIMPTGARNTAFEATPPDEVPEPPCGDYGFDPDGLRLFMTDTRWPDRVFYLNLGQDGTLFDLATIEVE